MEFDPVTLSRIQFALTAMYHFLFVPLTLGLGMLIALMETTYVITGREIWKDMTKFWGKLFGINFAMGVATGITMEFQFGTNWAYYSHYVGDIFGAPLAIEGMLAFFLESTFVGLFFFGWDKLSKKGHLIVTWLVAIGACLSALWIMIANAWMQNPVGAYFNPDSMRMELVSFSEVIFNPVAQTSFSHTMCGGFVTGAMFVISISAWYLLKKRHISFAKRSIMLAGVFGLITSILLAFIGDESGRNVAKYQKSKLAAIEAIWETEPAPAGIVLFGIPDMEEKTNHFEVKIPWVLGLMNTHSFHEKLPGIDDLTTLAKMKIRIGLDAYEALQNYKKDRNNVLARNILAKKGMYLGYALLLKKYVDNPLNANQEVIEKAAWDTIPHVPSLFASFRLMVGIGVYLIGFFALCTFLAIKNKLDNKKFLFLAIASLPAPWIANEIGWFVAEFGRQPWTIQGILPTFLSGSALSSTNVAMTLLGFIILYSTLAVVDVYLILKFTKLGPFQVLKGNVLDASIEDNNEQGE
jgi:cytochrome d ubiquinol oxidase subunit I